MDRREFHSLGRRAAAVIVTAPSVALATLCLREAIAETGGMSLNRLFHLALGLALLLLLVDFVVAIWHSRSPESALLLGAGGFAASLGGAFLGEVFGPPVLLVLVTVGIAWAVRLVRIERHPPRNVGAPARVPCD